MGKSIVTDAELPATIAPALGAKAKYVFQLTSDLNEVSINIAGTVTLSGAASALNKDGILELIQSVDLVANGKDIIASIPFHQLVNGNMFRRRAIDQVVVTQPGITAAQQSFSATGVLDLNAFAALRPKDSAVRETEYKTLELYLRFAPDFTSVFTGGTISASSFSVVVGVNETLEMPDAKGHQTIPILRPLFSYQEITIAGASAKNRLRLTPNQALRGLTLRMVNGAGTLTADNLLSFARVYTGKTMRTERTAAGIRAINVADMNSAVPTGYYYLDFAKGRGAPDRLNNCYDLRSSELNGADSYLEVDVLAACTVGITQWGYQDPSEWRDDVTRQVKRNG